MHDSALEEKKVILVILALLILAVLLGGIKHYYPQTANPLIYIQPNELLSKQELIRINIASSAELVELSGIGQVIAERIIDYREHNGPFKSKNELLKVKGIGINKLEKIKNQISLE
ncbi:MAG: helix-hairpin-helix domain-containing protein [Candidatus Omnitrophota bacterium]